MTVSSQLATRRATAAASAMARQKLPDGGDTAGRTLLELAARAKAEQRELWEREGG